MKILSLCFEDISNPSGGLGKWVVETYTRLSEMGHSISTVGFGFRQKDRGVWTLNSRGKRKCLSRSDFTTKVGEFSFIQVPSLVDFAVKDQAIIHLIQNESLVKTVLAFYPKEKFDIIHIHDYHAYRAAAVLKVLYKGSKIVMHSHLSDLIWHAKNAETETDKFFLSQELAALNGSNKIIAVSEHYKNSLAEFSGRDDIAVVHNGVDYKHLSMVSSDKTKDKTVCFCGRMTEQKGFSLLFKSIKELKGVKFNIISRIHPDSKKQCGLFKEFKQILDTHKNVTWFNDELSDEQKYKIMKSATVGVMPSTHEPFGLVALEFMALGVPLITTGVDGLGEFCIKENSILIDVTSEAIFRAIKKFKPSGNMLLNATRTAQKYTWDKTAREVEAVLCC